MTQNNNELWLHPPPPTEKTRFSFVIKKRPCNNAINFKLKKTGYM
jgi:hypothetical protein